MGTSFLERLAPSAPSDAAAPRPDDGEGLRAAVAAIVRGDELLFIKRADREGDPWSGHMAFPGGRRDPVDASLLDTARRETLEEIGVDLRAVARPVARLPDIHPFSRMPRPITVTPFVFSLERPATLALNDEVAAVVWASLEGVLRGEGATTFHFRHDGLDLELPAIAVGGEIVWGLTYRMIELLREAVTPR